METNPKVIDGKSIAEKIRQEISDEVSLFVAAGNSPPCVAVVLVGERKDSMTYVRMKERACKEIGINFIKRKLHQDSTEEEIIKTVQELNDIPWVDGILIQMPLPPNINSQKVLSVVDMEKDVDGFHPHHVGSLALRGHPCHFISCTPKGCVELLKREGIAIQGKHAVVVGRSNIVGLPLSLLLLKEDATVTVCHSKSQDLDKLVLTGDLVFAAVGSPLMIKKEWIKPGAVCIDVGVNAVDDPNDKRGYRLVGDIDYENVIEVASRITPVPGGVGPMTVAMLTRNTLDSAKRRKNRNT